LEDIFKNFKSTFKFQMILLCSVFLLTSFAGIQALDTCAPDGEYFYFSSESSNVIFDFAFEASRITLQVSRVI
jgi:hypothetical protein